MRKDILNTLVEAGIDLTQAKSLSNVLATEIGEIYQPIIEKANAKAVESFKTEYEKNQPKATDLVAKELETLGYESFESIQTDLNKFKQSHESYTQVLEKQKSGKISSEIGEYLTSKGIDAKYSNLAFKSIAKDGLFDENDEFQGDVLGERINEFVDVDLKDLVVVAPEQNAPVEQETKKLQKYSEATLKKYPHLR